MIRKERSFPVILLQLEALQRRLAYDHPARAEIEDELGRRLSGYRGEQILDYYTDYLPLQNHHFILRDLRLPISEQAFFQIDTLILTKNYFLIFEGKYMTGKLHFQPKQLVREQNGEDESFPNPIIQGKNQEYFLKELLLKYGYPPLPSDFYVVITHPNSIIVTSTDYPEVGKKVIRPQSLRFGFKHIEEKFTQRILTDSEQEEITQLLLRLHTPEEPDLLGRYGITKHELMKGIYCEDCKEFSVKRDRRRWRCQLCQNKNERAFIQALIDYRLLIGKTITNREFREFFGVESRHMAAKILRSLELPSKGEYKGKQYELSLEDLQKHLNGM